jgi:hypothetical protein
MTVYARDRSHRFRPNFAHFLIDSLPATGYRRARLPGQLNGPAFNRQSCVPDLEDYAHGPAEGHP